MAGVVEERHVELRAGVGEAGYEAISPGGAAGVEIEVLSPMGAATQEADARAFEALMQHIKQVDGSKHTVVMMQVENEVGVLGDSRDRSDAANKAFAGPVPAELPLYLKQHHDTLYPQLKELWEENGAKASGTWEDVFGRSARADEIFMAWHYARFVQAVTARGKHCLTSRCL